MGQTEDKFGSVLKGRGEGGQVVGDHFFFTGRYFAVSKQSESMLISMRETVMGKMGSNEVETSAQSSVLTNLKEQL